jgi:hypothetical protein
MRVFLLLSGSRPLEISSRCAFCNCCRRLKEVDVDTGGGGGGWLDWLAVTADHRAKKTDPDNGQADVKGEDKEEVE